MRKLSEYFSKLTGEQWFFTAVALLGALLRVEYLREFAALPHAAYAIGADVEEYHQRALEIVGGKIFSDRPDIHAPLYSWFLAGVYYLFDGKVIWARAVQLLVNFAAYTACLPLLSRLGASFRVRGWFYALAMLTPVLVFHQAELISETLLAPLTVAFFYFASREKADGKSDFGAGVMLGLLILTHGLLIFFAGAEVLFAMWKKQWRKTALTSAGIAAALVPVVAAGTIYYGRFTGVQSNGGFNLYIGHNADATGGCYLRPGRTWRKPLEAAEKEAQARGVSQTWVFVEKVAAFYRENPAAAGKLLLKKAALLLAPDEPVSGADPEVLIRMSAVQRYGAPVYPVVVAFAAVGVFAAAWKREKRFAHFYILAAALSAALLLTVVSGRYRQGLMPALLLLAALGAAQLKQMAYFLAVAALALTAVFIMPLKFGKSGEADAASILAGAYYLRGEYDAAEHYTRIAAAELDNPSRFGNMLGAFAEARGDFRAAEKYYLHVINEEPEFAEAFLNLAELYFFKMDRKSESGKFARAALMRDASLARAYALLGWEAWELRKDPDAEKFFIQALRYAPGTEIYKHNIAVIRAQSTIQKEK